MATHRGWVMVVRKREDGEFYAAERHLKELVSQNPQQFRKLMSVYGGYDLIVVVETNSLSEIHDAIANITARGGILYTSTYVAGKPDLVNAVFDDGEKAKQACLGVCTLPGQLESTRDELIRQGFDVADVVFGDFDILALFKPTTSYADRLRTAVTACSGIRKTTTMLPHRAIEGL